MLQHAEGLRQMYDKTQFTKKAYDNVTAVDWLANFSDYGVTTKLRESYKLAKSASKIWIQRFYDNLTTS